MRWRVAVERGRGHRDGASHQTASCCWEGTAAPFWHGMDVPLTLQPLPIWVPSEATAQGGRCALSVHGCVGTAPGLLLHLLPGTGCVKLWVGIVCSLQSPSCWEPLIHRGRRGGRHLMPSGYQSTDSIVLSCSSNSASGEERSPCEAVGQTLMLRVVVSPRKNTRKFRRH